MDGAKETILTLPRRDAAGIVRASSGSWFQAGCPIVGSQWFGGIADGAAGVRSFGR